jgi:nucleoside-diphosphate-sugar epimerase
MNFLVTGASGFLGGRAVEELLSQGKSVRALVRDGGSAEAFRQRGVDVVVGDVRSADTLRDAVKHVDVVLHCAAAVGPHFSKREIYDTNLNGVRHLLDAVKQAERGRVILVSSINVLGTRHLDPATEATPSARSNDPAADVKIEAEQLAAQYLQQGVDVVVVRPGFIYGPGDPHNIPKLARAIEGGKFRFIGKSGNIVPIVHVNDVVQALLLASSVPEARGRIYNVTDGSRTTIAELAGRIADCLGCPPPCQTISYFVPQLACLLFDAIGLVKKIKAPINRAGLRFLGTSRFVDIRRARHELGYSPRQPFPDGIADSVRWYKDHAEGTVHAG